MKVLLLSFALLCSGTASAQFHPYGDRDGLPPWPDSFGEKLHYLCSSRGPLDMRERQWLDELLLKFRENLTAVFKILDIAPNDKYLSKFLNSVSQSDLDQATRDIIYRIAYRRAVSNHGWNLTLARILNHTDVLTKEEIRSHLLSEDQYVRGAAEQALQRLATRERQRPGGEAGDGAQAGRNAPSPDSPGAPVAPLGETSIRMGLVAGLCALIAALGCWHWHRNVKPTKP
jgi:hypothetical protein